MRRSVRKQRAHIKGTIMMEYQPGDRVKHLSRDEIGTVSILPNGDIQVDFDNPTPKGRKSVGIYDANWFRLYPNALVKLP
jgi:hypothetical protein